MIRVSHVIAVGSMSLAFVGVADAGIVTYLDDVSGWSDAAGTTSFIDFVPPGGAPQVVSGLFYKELGVTLSGAWTDSPVDWYLKASGTSLDGFLGKPAYFADDAIGAIDFDSPISAFAMQKYVSSSGGVTFYLGDLLVGSSSISVPGLGSSHFFGWKTNFAFDRIVLNAGIDGGADNIYFSTVPGPGGAALLGLAGLTGKTRARRRS